MCAYCEILNTQRPMKYAVTVAKHSSIADLKVKLAELAGVAPNELTLADIYQVRVLHCVCARAEAGRWCRIGWLLCLLWWLVYTRARTCGFSCCTLHWCARVASAHACVCAHCTFHWAVSEFVCCVAVCTCASLLSLYIP